MGAKCNPFKIRIRGGHGTHANALSANSLVSKTLKTSQKYSDWTQKKSRDPKSSLNFTSQKLHVSPSLWILKKRLNLSVIWLSFTFFFLILMFFLISCLDATNRFFRPSPFWNSLLNNTFNVRGRAFSSWNKFIRLNIW